MRVGWGGEGGGGGGVILSCFVFVRGRQSFRGHCEMGGQVTWVKLCFHLALRPRRQDGLLGTWTEWEGDERVKTRPRKPSEKDRRDRGPPPEQWKCKGGVPSPLPATSALRNCSFNCCAGQSH